MTELPGHSVAIIGMAGRFPGASNVASFWQNILDGVESIGRFGPSELEDNFDAATRALPNFVPARSVLDDVELFDAPFFGMLPREAAMTDPQQRILLECAWEALEDAGYDPVTSGRSIGVFAGATSSTYLLHHLFPDRASVATFTSGFQVGNLPMLLGTAADFTATRIGYKLGLTGPCVALQSACSTSLLAVAQAVQSLLCHGCDMALAGGVSITFPQRRGYLAQDGGMVSTDGHCRAFDSRASGTVFGNGAGLVVLKRLDDAFADGDHIHAVIRGVGVNNDGAAKVGFAAPSVDGQAAAIVMAQAAAQVDARSIGYVECHGTGTPMGDPIEVAALTAAFRTTTEDIGFCALGSVKSNIGHLDVAAGVAGLIKATLAVSSGTVPASLHVNEPNPALDLPHSPFFIANRQQGWPVSQGPRRAGVSAFGVGGTNVHLVLEQAPEAAAQPLEERTQILPVSARSAAALAKARAQLADHLETHPEQDLSDVAFTLQTGRRYFPYRATAVGRHRADLIEALRAPAQATLKPVTSSAADLVFMFPGQGAQHRQMGRELYASTPVYRETVDLCAEILRPHLGLDLRAQLYPSNGGDHTDDLSATFLAQPAIFTVEYALARLLMSWGLEPAALIGHSVGEFAAACLAGVFTLDDALSLIATRGRLMQALPGGAMLAVRLPESELTALARDGIAVAALNAPGSGVLAGSFSSIEALEAELARRNVMHRRLQTSHAFHSDMIDPLIEPLTQAAAQIQLHPPAIPYISGVTGTWVTADQTTSPVYWARHAREPVRFLDGIATLTGDLSPALLEVGPGTALSSFALQGAASNGFAISCLPTAQGDADAMVHAAVARLWTIGASLDWAAYHGDTPRRRISLPTYPFERSRHWVEAPTSSPTMPTTAPAISSKHLPTNQPVQDSIMPAPAVASAPDPGFVNLVAAIFEDLSGRPFEASEHAADFLALGFDSLLLTQATQSLQTNFGVQIRFRQFFDELTCVNDVARHIAELQPATASVVASPVAPLSSVIPSLQVSIAAPAADVGSRQEIAVGLETLMREQLDTMSRLMERQLQVLSLAPMPSEQSPLAKQQRENHSTTPAVATTPTAEAPRASSARFRPIQKTRQTDSFDDRQRDHVTRLTARYVARTAGSKKLADAHRIVLADPRTVSGFTADWKEMVYPIVAARAQGARIWDVDGNAYIDLVNGYGQTAFGHAPAFVVEAVQTQLSQGFAIGPQSPLALEAAKLFCELTGHARVAFCNTGSEAVMAALRVARTVTGRDRVVTFAGAYHGQFDEVLVRGIGGGEGRRAAPAAPGIPAEAVGRLTVLDYGADESLAWIRAHAHELAAVLVEPVQSRRPGFLPIDFLKEVRAITAQSGTALILDEVVTGFRVHPAGVQALIEVKPDLATYGKVVGGGMPIGLLAGLPRFMDALDGGIWQFGDDSVPEVGVTFFAGTFVRHPLALAAMVAVLKHVAEKGLALQAGLTARMGSLVEGLRAAFVDVGWEVPIESYGSVLYFEPGRDHRLGSLLFYHLRARGIFIQEHYPCFLTTEHGEAEIAEIVRAFRDSLEEMQRDGMLPSSASPLADAVRPAAARQPNELPLTEAQMEIWLSAQAGSEASSAFNESVSLTLDGILDTTRLVDAVQSVATRHAILQATFAPDGTKMRIEPVQAFPISVIDLESASDPQDTLRELIDALAYEPFDLVEGPVAKAQIVRLAEQKHVLLFSAHHIVCDGWSVNVLLNEIATAYRSKSETLPAPMSFADYAAQSRDGELAKTSAAYWAKVFSDIPEPLELPTDHPRPPLRSFNGGTRTHFIDAELYRAVKTTGARYRSTLFCTLFSAFEILLFKLSNQRDLVIGVPAAGQSLAENDRLVGHCVNFLPIRDAIDPSISFAQHLDRMGRVILDAYDHQSCTLGTVLKRLRIPPVSGRLPLVEVQFNLERLGENIDFGSGLRVQAAPNPKMFSTFDLYVNITESDDGLRTDCCYNADLFDATTIDRWFGHFRTLLAAFVAQPDVTISAMPLLDVTERQRVVSDRNFKQTVLPEQDVIAPFEALALRQPQAVAVCFGDEEVSYGALNAWANRIAEALRRTLKGSEPCVALLIERSPALVAAMLGALKAGFPYVPLDPTMPRGRMRSILRDSEAVVILAAGTSDLSTYNLDIEIETIDINQVETEPEDGAPARPLPESLAYIMYTSGSTGAPKGVEVTRSGLANLLSTMADEPGFDRSDTLLAVTTITFDIAGLELLLPLVQGGRVVIASSQEAKDAEELLRLLEKSGTTVMQATPMTWRLLLEAGFESRPGLRMLCGGEALPLELARKLLTGGGELWNMYGPTETTIWSSTIRIHPEDEMITIGRPIANTQFYVVDSNDQPVPIGVPGELLIGGAGVARGYAGNPKLTARSFIGNPFVSDPSARVYRSGDRVQYLADGRIQHLGRLDQQIKLRGFRIEPGEIEAVLARKAGIVSVVVLREDNPNAPMLVCYYVPSVEEASPPPNVLRSLLVEEVPDYMVPAIWINLPALPLNASGKIDRAALPAPDQRAPISKVERIEPNSAVEQTLCRIWGEVLRREDIGVKDDLFDLGADSLSIFQITARARREGLKLSARDLFRNRTIAGLAAAMAEASEPEAPTTQPFWKRALRRQPIVARQIDQGEPDIARRREQR